MDVNKNNMDSYQGNQLIEGKVDLIGMLKKIWSIRVILCKFACVGALIGLIIGLSIPKQYIVSVILAPEMRDNKAGGGLAGMAASFLGTMPQIGVDALTPSLAPEIVQSTPFLLEMLDVQIIDSNSEINTTLSAYLEEESAPWWNVIIGLPGKMVNGIKSVFTSKDENQNGSSLIRSKGVISLSVQDANKINQLKQKITAVVDNKNSLIALNASFQHPLISAIVVDSVLSKLQKYIINYKVSKAKDDCEYWEKLNIENKEKYYNAQQRYARYVDANNNMIFQSTLVERERLQNEMNLAYQIYSQVAQQLQLAQAKVQESKPVFTVVEPAVVPNAPMGISKKVLMIMFAFFAVVGGIAWELFGKNLFMEIKDSHTA